MVRINLLPHREQKRQARQRQFVSLAVGLAILGIAVVGLGHVVIAARIDNQNNRNNLLKTEIATRRRRCWRGSRWSKPCRQTEPKRCICSTSWSASCPTAFISRRSGRA